MKRLTAFASIILIAMPSSAVAESLYEKGYEAWHAHRFPDAYSALIEFRRGPYGRRPTVDFMLGTSACRISQRQSWGYNVLDWMLYAYPLTLDSRVKVAHERDICRQAAQGSGGGGTIGEISEIVEERAAGMTAFGKTFYWAQEGRQPVASYPIHRAREIPLAEFQARLTPIGNAPRALAQARKLAQSDKAIVHEKFLIVSLAGHSNEDMTAIGQTLSRYVGFLESRYGIAMPESYLSIYLLRDPYSVHDFADRLHGLDVSRATIGYTFVDDLSVVGAVPDRGAGTILHELFHLLARRAFGDIPQWLDEGVAALYEVSGRKEDHYFGLPNWRGRVLEELWNDRPSVGDLIQTEWFLFDDPDQQTLIKNADDRLESYFDNQEGRRQAAMMAMARYFLLYLDERNELVPVFKAVRDQKFGDETVPARERVLALVEATLGRSVGALDNEFTAWFQSGGPDKGRMPVSDGQDLFVTTANVNVRIGPGTGFDRLLQLRRGTTVAVFGEKYGWRQIQLRDGTIGYIFGRYLMPAKQSGSPL